MATCERCGKRTGILDKHGHCEKCHNELFVARMKEMAGDGSPDVGIKYEKRGLFRKTVGRLCGAELPVSKIDARTGYCLNCTEKLKTKYREKRAAAEEIPKYQNRSKIVVGFGLPEGPEITPTDEELRACQIIKEALADRFDVSAFSVEKKSSNYTTLVYKKHDVLRVKITDRAKWISVYVYGDDRDAYADSPLFAIEKNKQQLAWKAAIEKADDVAGFADFCAKSCALADIFAKQSPEIAP